jgi:hypothetical protein
MFDLTKGNNDFLHGAIGTAYYLLSKRLRDPVLSYPRCVNTFAVVKLKTSTMSAESFFTEVAASYRKLLLSTGAEASVSGLREYCRNRHVAWRAFQHWSCGSDIASDLPVYSARSTIKKKSSPGKPATRKAAKAAPSGFYPLRFTPHPEILPEVATRESDLLHDVCISCPGRLVISIRRGSSRAISALLEHLKP